MAEIFLEAQARPEKGKQVRKLRRSGFIPAVIYGGGRPGNPIKINEKDFVKTLKGHSIGNLIVTLKLADQKKKKGTTALIRDVQVDPLKDVVIHVDFQEVSLEEKLRTKVRVESRGEPAGVTQQGGILECTLREIEIESLPMNIPEALIIDVSHLNIGGAVYVRDVQPPEGVDILTPKDISVFSVAAPKMEEEVPKEAEITEPEVIAKGKEAAEVPEGEVAAQKEGAPAKKEPEAKEGEKKEAEKKK